ncbi:DUF1415 domain-containing protein [Flocculibacter collagenilyticus]|uniref:DUF1415 domain-containing protein n=1 Tax=Flocculibacter collagenilyticus TaxID=2744479 RepID=UPI0018F655F7|nr:DUF1415 domain-containing protein [Flocculibacter collagenilyticus]
MRALTLIHSSRAKSVSDLKQNNTVIIQNTRAWVQQFIVELNICPFAKKEVERNTIRYFISSPDDAETQNSQTLVSTTILNDMMDCFTELDQEAGPETTLMIFPNGFDDFEDYLFLVDTAQVTLEQMGYLGIYQLATFHPNYIFEGEDAQDASNYTNRSPYPMLHIIKESGIERVLKTYKHPEQIPENNIALMNKLGVDYLSNLLHSFRQSAK